MAGSSESEDLEPIEKAVLWTVSKSPGRNNSERRSSPETSIPQRPSLCIIGEGSTDRRKLAEAAELLWRGSSDGTETRTR